MQIMLDMLIVKCFGDIFSRRNEQDGEMELLTDLFNLVLRSSVAEGQYAL